QPLTLLAIEGEGTQREVILGTWKQALTESGVRYLDDAAAEQVNVIHQYESCTKVERVKDSNHFIVHTNKGSYKTRRVVLAIGLRGTPKQLGDADHPVPGEEIEIERKFNGEVRRGRKVMYKLREPAQFRGLKLLVVGGGNSAVETAVDLVAARNSNEIDFLSANEINSVTLLIRSDFTKDVKFGNKRQIYQCIDQDKVKVRRGLQVKEIRAREVVIEDLRTRVTET